MGLVDGVANGFAQLMGKKIEVAETTTVTLEDVSTKGWWANKAGEKIHVDPEKMVMIQDGKELTIVELETPRKILEEGGFKLTSLPPEERIAPAVVEIQEAAFPGAQVIDLATARVATGGEPVSVEQEHKNVLALESEQVSVEIEKLKEQLMDKLTKIGEVLAKTKKTKATTPFRNEVLRLSVEMSSLYSGQLAFEETQIKTPGLSEEDVSGCRGRLESFKAFESQVDALVSDFEKLNQIEATSPVETGNAAGAHDNLNVLLQARANAPKIIEDPIAPLVVTAGGKKEAAKKKKTPAILAKTEGATDSSKGADERGSDGSGPEGPNGPESFDTLLKARQEKVAAIIDAITTPQEFALFRGTMRKVEVKDSQEVVEVRWYFINQDTLAEELSKNEKLLEKRKLNDAEKKQVYIVEDFLRDKIRRKFFELKDADVDSFYNQEQAKITAAQSEADLEALMASWPKQLEDIVTWKDLFDTLTEVEKNKVDDGYREAIDTLKQGIEIQKKELQLAPAYQSLDTFLERGDKAKEKVRMFLDALKAEYEAYSTDVYRVVKEKGGTISRKRRWDLWQEQGGDSMAERIIVESLHTFDKVDPEEGKKIFQAISDILRKES